MCFDPANWFAQITADGALQILVLIVQSYLIYLAFRLSRDAETRSQKHDRLSVMPVLEVITNSTDNLYEIRVLNCGIGPALVTETVMYIDGAPFHSDDNAGIKLATVGLIEKHKLIGIYIAGGRFTKEAWLGADKEQRLLRIDFGPATTFDQVSHFAAGIELKLRYQSIYGDERTAVHATP